ncbi:pyridine nucleotide-disulfide oxidoreductase domain-containing protein 1-like [Liolophura sinensis]|uniref:pyridine nucleotide-disulfide oxidoreductase domain-containing protein 1-like n=1 Tax=Liolophura sinensis TaxID=3198878 RepID=UPI0031594A03
MSVDEKRLIDEKTAAFVVIGGGIAGVTCAETLSALSPEKKVILITASPLIKAVTNFQQLSKALETFDVVEKPSSSLQSECSNVEIIHASVTALDSGKHIVETDAGKTVKYDKLCICTGGKPKLICKDNPYVIGIRDTESVQAFQKKLSGSRRIVVVGNGGIATELVYEVQGCEVVWAIKDDSISTMYLDAGAAQFILPKLKEGKPQQSGLLKRLKYTVADSPSPGVQSTPGGALGPDWAEKVTLKGGSQGDQPRVHVEYKVEVKEVWTAEEFNARNPGQSESSSSGNHEEWPVCVELTNGVVYGCDLVVSATGVYPNTHPFVKDNQFRLGADGGLEVNSKMQTSVQDVFAAGDVCTAGWQPSPLWQQMRLWSQARQMGAYSAKCMLADLHQEDIHMDFCFELFAHVTKFFNYKVILLGKYNAHGLGKDYHVLLRMTEGKEYVKTVMHDGKMVGATLIGETDLEETFENLILNQMDLSSFGEDLLYPGVDIQDFFD